MTTSYILTKYDKKFDLQSKWGFLPEKDRRLIAKFSMLKDNQNNEGVPLGPIS
jgi:hypothetical protein